ncbi:MAG TPA: ABC transporter permease, partial [Bryobacteraceae bacterium]|nr:ABC transporter permease [Bryobacteraceae bacterium]
MTFGGIESSFLHMRAYRSLLPELVVDLRYAWRRFAHAPLFTVIIIGILALGLGANISTFSVTDALLLRLLPVKDPAMLFRTVGISADAAAGTTNTSYQMFRQMQKRMGQFAELMAYSAAAGQSISREGAGPERVSQQTVSGNFFSVLGVQAILGRTISTHDDAMPGSSAVAVISYNFWVRDFGGSTSGVVGRKLRLGDHSFEIIGVTPRQFLGVEVGKTVDVWTPTAMAPAANLKNDHLFWLQPMGRLKPGATIAQAVAPMQAVRHEFMLEDVRQHAPPGTPPAIIQRFLAGTRIRGVGAGGGVSSLRSEYRQPLQIMMFLVALVLLITCTNVANLLIARGSSRQQEIAIRLSLGASRARVWRQLITESLLLGIISASVGLLLAHWAAPVLVRLLAPSSDPVKLATGIGPRLLAFTGSLALLTVLVCGILPAFRLSGPNIHAVFKNGGRLTRGGGFARKTLVALQIALSLVLVVGAVLFTRTLLNLMSSSLGFHPNEVLVTHVSYEDSHNERSSLPAWQKLLQSTRELPGVEFASLASASLFSGNPGAMGLRTAGAVTNPPDPTAGVVFVSNAYFETLGIRFTSGRDFDMRDSSATAPSVGII